MLKTTFSKTKVKSTSDLLRRCLMFCACLLMASTVSIYAQTKVVTGTVMDEFKEPLMGASISIKGTATAVITNLNGNYSVSAKETDILVFSFIGMVKQEIAVGNQAQISVTLLDDSKLLTEVAVIGYGSAKKIDLTGSIATVKATEIADRPSSNPVASIQGRVAGVQIINSGRPGQDPEVLIRGTNSINGSRPLYVVDGLFTDNINYLNPADIESMSILKDASSLAIFGVRGANGVIIITTKKAKEGQTIVNINTSFGWKHVSDRISMTNAAQFKELYSEQLSNLKADPFDYTPWTADTNWQDEIFQTGFITNNNASVTSSTDKSKFYLGVGYSKEEGIIKSEEYSKITVNLNSEHTISKIFKFGYQVNASRARPADAKNVASAVLAAPITPKYGTYSNPLTEKEETLIHITPSFQKAQLYNPLLAIETAGNHARANNYRAAGNIFGDATITKNINFRATFSLDYKSEESRSYTPIFYVYNPDGNVKENLYDMETIEQFKLTDLGAQQDYILTYTNTFGVHNITGTAGITTNYRERSKLTAGRSQSLSNGEIDFSIPNDNPDLWWISSIGSSRSTNSGEQHRRFTMSYLARALYNYNNKYMLNASFRRDGSSVFRGTGNTWDNFYSVGAGWVVTDENFMKDQKIIDHLKLRGSWGILGSENTGKSNYPSYPVMSNVGGAVFGDRVINSYNYNFLVQDLGWEKTHSWEAGLEIVLLNNRLRFEPVYYSKRTKDIIVQLAGQGGVQNALQNLGDVENKGWELSASWDDKIGSTGFTYGVNANLTTINNKVINIGSGDDYAVYSGVARTLVGYPIGHFYGYKVEGVYQNIEDIRQSPSNTVAGVKPGDLKFADIDGDGKITDKDRTNIGNPTPDFTYGLNLALGYKNFDITVDMMGVYGNEIFRNWGESEHAVYNFRAARLDRWHGEGTSNWEPILDNKRAINRQASTYFVEDGSYFRIRNVQLGYTFSNVLLQKISLKSLRIYGNIQNLKTWSKNSTYTPEIGGSALESGVDKGTYPVPAVYTVGLNFTF